MASSCCSFKKRLLRNLSRSLIFRRSVGESDNCAPEPARETLAFEGVATCSPGCLIACDPAGVYPRVACDDPPSSETVIPRPLRDVGHHSEACRVTAQAVLVLSAFPAVGFGHGRVGACWDRMNSMAHARFCCFEIAMIASNFRVSELHFRIWRARPRAREVSFIVPRSV